jgi:hypothetical protein
VFVAFDATVLWGALRKPTGYNFKLLELVADGTLLQGFTTDIAGMEFVSQRSRRARRVSATTSS